MGRSYLKGDASIREVDAAYYWFQQAAERNSPEAQFYLGVIIRDGLGRPADPEQARDWFELAASQGYVPAYFPTGKLYFNAPPDPLINQLSGHDLAMAYLWLSATAKRSQDPSELAKSADLLTQIRTIMPETWIPTLDAKVTAHLSAHSPPSGPAKE